VGWPVQVVDVTGSTNADLAEAARAGDLGPRVLAARAQRSGRGRLGREWQSPPGASLSVSLLWTPQVPQAGWPWLPMVVGLGVLDALSGFGVAAGLKWPNDVVVDTAEDQGEGQEVDQGEEHRAGATAGLRKLAGILLEGAGGPDLPAVVAGVGINLDDPRPDHEGADGHLLAATSLRRLGAPVGFDDALAAVLPALTRRLDAWQADGGDVEAGGLRAEYRRACTTIGRDVRVLTPGGARRGRAVDVDTSGALVLEGPEGRTHVQAGDVEHVR
jgi:BirA family biotin operon repressor/biotin-[acetyl-CoA-carboxylase] ligase